jgi:hypothetical protein
VTCVSMLGGWLVKFFQSTPNGCVRSNERLVARLSGLTNDEAKVGLTELRRVGIVKRFRVPETRLQWLVLDPELFGGASCISAESFHLRSSSNERRDRTALLRATARLARSDIHLSRLAWESMRTH